MELEEVFDIINKIERDFLKLKKMIETSLENPDKSFYDELFYPMSEASKALNIPTNRLFKILREKRILKSLNENKNMPFERFIENGYFKIINKDYEKDGEIKQYNQTYVSNKGLIFLSGKLNLDIIDEMNF